MEKIPIGKWIESGVYFVTEHYEPHFRAVSDGINACLEAIIRWVSYPYPPVIILLVAFVAYLLKRSLKKMLLVSALLLLVWNLGYWQQTIQTLALVIFSSVLAVLIGVPMGIMGAHMPRVYRVIQPVLDFMQTIPTFVYLIPTLMLFGLGFAPGVISTVVFALPATIRLTYLGMKQVPHNLRELSYAFGGNFWDCLFKIEIPHALPSIQTGISQCVMLSLSMVVIAALVGAEGLGQSVVQALNTVNIEKGFEAGLVIVIIAILLDRSLQRKVNPLV